ncbi:unnamed protein product [Mytilus coruscus]|uniref:Uncharacterized protein n=1 Tax=Mytilus coruscus TaxID=42192 RepID=A0A6J8D420_MYTCO|nr:unnamed protein product [Mytilus coruscus]
MGYMVINYLDDFGGADTVDKAEEAYNALGALLESCGQEESKQKVATTTKMEFLGITVDTLKLTFEVTRDRVQKISLLVQAWLRKKKVSLRESQSLLEKLHFVSTCVRPGRIFVSRLLNWLRCAFPSNVVGRGHKIFRRIQVDVQKDLLWWQSFMSSYNGNSMICLEDWSSPDEIFSSDACYDGFGAILLQISISMQDFLRKRATIVSASKPKYVSGIDGCTTQVFSGATIGRLTELISSGNAELSSVDFVIIVYVGTYNISSSQSIDTSTIMSYFEDFTSFTLFLEECRKD